MVRHREPRQRPDNTAPWRIDRFLDKGGNCYVWVVSDAEGRRGALKCLFGKYQRPDSKKIRRFRDEVAIQTSLQGDPGILPLLDAHVPESPSPQDPAWLVTAFAKPIKKALGKNPTLTSVVEAIASIAEVLARLHAQGVAHRDIKPGNLFLFQGTWVVGDLGLVTFPGKAGLTSQSERVGPRDFTAPELRRDTAGANFKTGDVFGLGKTLWVLAMGQNRPLDGEHPLYGPGRISDAIPHPRAYLLDAFIYRATKTNPDERCTMADLASWLRGWLRPPPVPGTPPEITDLLAGLRAAQERAQAAARTEAVLVEQARQVDKHLLTWVKETQLLLGKDMPAGGPGYTDARVIPGIVIPAAVARYDKVYTGGAELLITGEGSAGRSPITLHSGYGIVLTSDQRLHMAAAHILMRHGQLQVIWTDRREAQLASNEMEEAAAALAAGLSANLRHALERLNDTVNPPPSAGPRPPG